MRPKGIVEGEVSVLAAVGVFGVEELRHVAGHIHAELAVHVRLALVERAHSYSHFHTHIFNLSEIKQPPT